jgi:hypothetical protein
VQMAFAGPDLEADFAKMKGADIDEELGIEQKRNKILNDGTDIRTNCLLIGSSAACPLILSNCLRSIASI